MAFQSIAQIHTKNGIGNCSVSIFMHTHGEAADASDYKSEYYGKSKQIAGRPFFMNEFFNNLHTEESTQKPADNSLIGIKIKPGIW